MITGPFPAELERLVQAEMAAGDFKSPAEVLLAGMRLLHESREFERLKAEVQLGIDQIERGEFKTYDANSLGELMGEIKERGRARLAEQGKSLE